jgi:hypothetical protein
MEVNMEIPLKRVKIEVSHNPAIPLLGIPSKERKSVCQRPIFILIFTTVLSK